MSSVSPSPDTSMMPRAPLLRLRRSVLLLGGLSLALGLIWIGVAAIALALVDSAVPSRSVASVVGLATLAAALSAFGIVIGAIRRRSAARLATVAEIQIDALTPAMLTARADLSLREGLAIAEQRQAVGRLIGSPATLAALDLLALPLSLGITFALGWPLGTIALAAVIAASLTLLSGWRSAAARHAAVADDRQRHAHLAATAAREAAPLAGQGMAEQITALLRAASLATATDRQAAAARLHALAGRIAAIFLAGGVLLVVAAAVRIIATQATIGSAILAVALYLMIARPFVALAQSVEVVVEGRAAIAKLRERLASWIPAALTIAMPAPREQLSLENVALYRPGTRQPLLQQISAKAAAGEIVAVVGPSGVGKSVLLQTLALREATRVGAIRLDGCEIGQWPVGDLNRHIGYLPQEIDLFEGSVAENIARFDPLARSQDVLAAARAAGIHERLVRLDQGYDTPVGPAGRNLPLALRQRVGLARAVFGDPLLVLLDDPAAHLDAREAAELIEAVQATAQRGGIVLIATGSPRLIDIADHVMILRQGRMIDFGPREAVRDRVTARRKLAATPRAAQTPASSSPMPSPAPSDA